MTWPGMATPRRKAASPFAPVARGKRAALLHAGGLGNNRERNLGIPILVPADAGRVAVHDGLTLPQKAYSPNQP
jgi:hypothetical protein